MLAKRTLMSEEEISEALAPFWIADSKCPSCQHARPGFYALSPTERDREIARAQAEVTLKAVGEELVEKVSKMIVRLEAICLPSERRLMNELRVQWQVQVKEWEIQEASK